MNVPVPEDAINVAAEILTKADTKPGETPTAGKRIADAAVAQLMLEAAAPHLAAAERARCLAEIEQFRTILAGPVNGYLTDAVPLASIRHVLVNGPTPEPAP